MVKRERIISEIELMPIKDIMEIFNLTDDVLIFLIQDFIEDFQLPINFMLEKYIDINSMSLIEAHGAFNAFKEKLYTDYDQTLTLFIKAIYMHLTDIYELFKIRYCNVGDINIQRICIKHKTILLYMEV